MFSILAFASPRLHLQAPSRLPHPSTSKVTPALCYCRCRCRLVAPTVQSSSVPSLQDFLPISTSFLTRSVSEDVILLDSSFPRTLGPSHTFFSSQSLLPPSLQRMRAPPEAEQLCPLLRAPALPYQPSPLIAGTLLAPCRLCLVLGAWCFGACPKIQS